VDPVPDPLLLRKSDSAWNRTRTSGSVARRSTFIHSQINCECSRALLSMVLGLEESGRGVSEVPLLGISLDRLANSQVGITISPCGDPDLVSHE
jgi:hypothetical protein